MMRVLDMDYDDFVEEIAKMTSRPALERIVQALEAQAESLRAAIMGLEGQEDKLERLYRLKAWADRKRAAALVRLAELEAEEE